MADISKVEIGGVSYNVKDATARKLIEELPSGGGGGGAGSWKDLGEGFGEGVLLEETTLTEQSTQIDKELGLVAESVYTVNWNGTEYTPTAVDASAMVGVTGAVVLGMSSKYPFTILAKPGNGTSISIDSGIAPVTVSISGLGNTIIPIPTKYLPKPLQFGEEGGMVEVLPETTVGLYHQDGCEQHQFDGLLGLVVGKKYKVVYNGKEYEYTAVVLNGMGVGFGNIVGLGLENNGEPFGVAELPAYNGWNLMDYNGNTEVTLSITTEGTIIPIEGKYLPKGTPWIGEGKVYLEECEGAPYEHPALGKVQLISAVTNLEIGKTYKVTYNGASFNCVCQAAPEGMSDDPNAVAMGNFAVIGGANTGEPFAMLISSEYQRIDVIDLLGAQSVRVGIFSTDFNRKRLDEVCVAESTPKLVNVIGFKADNGSATVNMSFEEIRSYACDSNAIVRVIAVVNGTTGQNVILPLVSCGASGAMFSAFLVENGQKVAVALIVHPDGSTTFSMGA